MNELKKLETTGYSSKLDEIAKNDTEVFLKVKLSGRRTFGEYEFEPKNGFAVHFGNHIDVLDLDKCDVYQLDQPQLTPNQQIVVNDVKQDHENYGIPKFNAIHLAFTTYATGYYRDHLKNDEEFYQVLSTLIVWALEQEEE